MNKYAYVLYTRRFVLFFEQISLWTLKFVPVFGVMRYMIYDRVPSSYIPFIHFLIMFPLQFAGYIRVDIYAIIVFLNHFSFSTSSYWTVRFFSTFFFATWREPLEQKIHNNSRFCLLCLFVLFFLTGSC